MKAICNLVSTAASQSVAGSFGISISSENIRAAQDGAGRG